VSKDVGDDRRGLILAMARESGHVDVASLAASLEVSTETVRRDLKALEDQGLVSRNHGGAYPVESAAFETSLAMRSGSRVAEKHNIAAAAVTLLEEAETVYLDEGFTPYLVAEALLEHPKQLTVVTSSLQIGGLIASKSSHTAIMLGGRVRGRTVGTVDHWALDMLSDFNIGVAVLGANGISRDKGLTTPDPAVAAVKSAAVAASRRRIFVGVHTKFGVVSFCRFADVSDFEVIITEAALPPREASLYAAMGPRVLRT
jgi:DeoR/GlpR family transcriptional regulator of sugar metabolism